MPRILVLLFLLSLASSLSLGAGCLKKQTETVEFPTPGDWHDGITATVFSFARHEGDTSGISSYNDVNPLGEENPYYVALPFNHRIMPASDPLSGRELKNRWLEIFYPSSGRRAYAQVEDTGPWFVNDHEYVFQPGTRPFAEFALGRSFTIYKESGGERLVRNQAGIDLSPAVAAFLGLNGKGMVRWRFVADHEVGPGPWLEKISTLPSHFRPRSPRAMYHERNR